MKTLRFGRPCSRSNPPRCAPSRSTRASRSSITLPRTTRSAAIVQNSPGPFVVLPCICRKSNAMRGKACAKTSREETCLAFGDMAKMVLRRKHCREVSREEVLAILERNEEDGLVLQPANTQQPEFICSCCGCCCGMLSFQRLLPRPVDFWSSSFFAEVTRPPACTAAPVSPAARWARSRWPAPRARRCEPGPMHRLRPVRAHLPVAGGHAKEEGVRAGPPATRRSCMTRSWRTRRAVLER